MDKTKLFLVILAVISLVIFYSSIFADESIAITTYYPSPYGSYQELITTGNTYLATSSGNVGIGKTNPGYKLDVLGNAAITGNINVSGNISVSNDIAVYDDLVPSGKTNVGIWEWDTHNCNSWDEEDEVCNIDSWIDDSYDMVLVAVRPDIKCHMHPGAVYFFTGTNGSGTYIGQVLFASGDYWAGGVSYPTCESEHHTVVLPTTVKSMKIVDAEYNCEDASYSDNLIVMGYVR